MTGAGHTKISKPRPWWMELLLVDFRHAFWPWLVYTVAVMCLWLLPTAPLEGVFQYTDISKPIFFAVALAGPAMVTRTLTSDFGNGTMATLLAMPRNRSHIWFVRTAGLALMFFLPLLICAVPLPHPWTTWVNTDQFLLSAAMVTLTAMAWCYAATGALLAVVLKKPLLVWSAILISPIIILLLFALAHHLTGLDFVLKPGDQLRSPINEEFWFNLIFGAIAYCIAWQLWVRLEVRS